MATPAQDAKAQELYGQNYDELGSFAKKDSVDTALEAEVQKTSGVQLTPEELQARGAIEIAPGVYELTLDDGRVVRYEQTRPGIFSATIISAPSGGAAPKPQGTVTREQLDAAGGKEIQPGVYQLPNGAIYYQNPDLTYSPDRSTVGGGSQTAERSNASILLGLNERPPGGSLANTGAGGGAQGASGQGTRVFGENQPYITEQQALAEGNFIGTPIFGSTLPAVSQGIPELGGMVPNTALLNNEFGMHPNTEFGGYYIDPLTGQPVSIGTGFSNADIYGTYLANQFNGGINPAEQAAILGKVQRNTPEYWALLGINPNQSAAAATGAIGQQNAAHMGTAPGAPTNLSSQAAQTAAQQSVEQVLPAGNVQSEAAASPASQDNANKGLASIRNQAIAMGYDPSTAYDWQYQADGGTNMVGTGRPALNMRDSKGFQTPNPVMIMDMRTMRPLAIAGEAGPERLSVKPMMMAEGGSGAAGIRPMVPRSDRQYIAERYPGLIGEDRYPGYAPGGNSAAGYSVSPQEGGFLLSDNGPGFFKSVAAEPAAVSAPLIPSMGPVYGGGGPNPLGFQPLSMAGAAPAPMGTTPLQMGSAGAAAARQFLKRTRGLA